MSGMRTLCTVAFVLASSNVFAQQVPRPSDRWTLGLGFLDPGKPKPKAIRLAPGQPFVVSGEISIGKATCQHSHTVPDI